MNETQEGSFEERMKADTFSDLQKKVQQLTETGNYKEARLEISNELNLFAQSIDLATPIQERRERLKAEFEASLPESLRLAMESSATEPEEEPEEKIGEEAPGKVIARYEKEGWEYMGSVDPKDSPDEKKKRLFHLKVVDAGGLKLVFRPNNSGDYSL